MPLSDREILCSFMEPKPSPNTHGSTFRSGKNWWHWDGREWIPCDIELNECHKIEGRLTDSQWQHYAVLMFHVCCTEARTSNLIEDLLTKNRRALLHADASTKITALAEVLRPIVEAPNAA